MFEYIKLFIVIGVDMFEIHDYNAFEVENLKLLKSEVKIIAN